MRALFTITGLTIHEAARRRILLAAALCGLAFLVLFAIGFHYIATDVSRQGRTAPIERRMVLNFFLLAGLYAVNFLTVMTAVLLPVDTLSGEISSGVMQTLASKPIRRSEIVLGKWLAYVLLVGAYLFVMAGGILLIGQTIGGLIPPRVTLGLPLMALGSVVLVTLSILGGTRFATVTNGVVVFGMFGLAFIGGWVEQVAALTGNAAARDVGTVASLIMPSEALWQLAAHHMQMPIMADLHVTPFSPASVPSVAMVWWAAGYALVALVAAVLSFRRREL